MRQQQITIQLKKKTSKSQNILFRNKYRIFCGCVEKLMVKYVDHVFTSITAGGGINFKFTQTVERYYNCHIKYANYKK